MHDVFISYARSERASVEPVKNRLVQRGLSVFFDVDGLDGGDQFPDKIDKAVKSAKCVLGVWSANALKRPWVINECRVGFRRGVLVTAALEAIEPLSIPTEFGAPHLVDIGNDAALWRAILAKIGEDPTARLDADPSTNNQSIGAVFDYYRSAQRDYKEGMELYWGYEHARVKDMSDPKSMLTALDAQRRNPLMGIGNLWELGSAALRIHGNSLDPRGPQSGWPKARELLERAARLGHPEAMENLAAMLERGHGGSRDSESARLWLERARSVRT